MTSTAMRNLKKPILK